MECGIRVLVARSIMNDIRENENVSDDDILQTLQERIFYLEQALTKVGWESKGTKKKKFRTKKQSVVLYGMSRALCIETLDPWKENRVRFYHPILHDPKDKLLSYPWASPVSAMGGHDDCGLNWVPPAGSTLIVFFEGGIKDSAFYVGTTWHRNRGPGGTGFPLPFREWQIYSGHRTGYFHGPNSDPNDESQVLPQWNTENYNSKDINDFSQFNDPCDQRQLTFPHIYGMKTPEKHMIKMDDGDAKCNRRWKRMEIQSGCGNWMIFKDDHIHYGGHWAHPSCSGESAKGKNFVCSEHKTGYPYYTDIVGKPIENPTCKKHGKCVQTGCKQCEEAFLVRSKCSSYTLHGEDEIFDTPDDITHVDLSTTFGSSRTPGYPPLPLRPGEPPTVHWKPDSENGGQNPNFKHKNECRPYSGPGTPQNNKCQLPQSGIQFLSISGHTLVMDDSVEEPRGKPEWERSIQPFDFGCNDKYLGILWMKSATGHSFVMSDIEEDSKIRGERNIIELRTGNGNYIQLNDHTIKNKPTNQFEENENCSSEGQKCPPDYAGEHRGIHLISTSNHKIKMIDHLNEQCGPVRSEGGSPMSKAKRAYVLVQTGYGTEMRFNDDFSQEQTQSQWIQILHPQCVNPDSDPFCQSCDSNECRGPHIMRFQGRQRGIPGVIYLRAGGHSVRQTYDMDIVLVGDKEKNPSDKFTYVSKKRIAATEDIDFRYSGELHIFFAEKQILLMAGRDCPPKEGKKCCGPCLYNVIIARCPVFCPLTGILHWTEKAMSERVFASGHHPCQSPPDCGSGCAEYFAAMAKCGKKGCKEDEATQDIDTGAGIITISGQDDEGRGSDEGQGFHSDDGGGTFTK